VHVSKTLPIGANAIGEVITDFQSHALDTQYQPITSSLSSHVISNNGAVVIDDMNDLKEDCKRSDVSSSESLPSIDVTPSTDKDSGEHKNEHQLTAVSTNDGKGLVMKVI
jgi:hypothetical protein